MTRVVRVLLALAIAEIAAADQALAQESALVPPLTPAVAADPPPKTPDNATPGAGDGVSSPEATSPPEPNAAAPPTSLWFYELTPEQVRALQNAGCRFSQTDVDVARRMHQRLFTTEQLVEAYAEAQREGVVPAGVEALAVFPVIRLPISEYPQFVKSRGTLTEYYNERIGGQTMRKVGLYLLGGGAVSALLGAILAFAPCDTKEEDNNCLGGVVGGVFLMITGGASMAVGIPPTIIGLYKANQWAPDRLLDDGTTADMARYGLRAGRPRSSGTVGLPEARLFPLVGDTGGGIGLGVSF